MRVLLTGVSGFVGRAVLRALLRRRVPCLAISRTHPEVDGDFDWYSGDLLDHTATADTIQRIRPDRILHLAWTVEHGRFWTAPANLDWVAATLNLAQAAAKAGTKRFVGVGTCYEYDWPADASCSEKATLIKPSMLYGIAKDATRRVLEEFSKPMNMSFAWARLFFLYGAGEGAARLVPSIASALAAAQPAKCSSGRGIRDFIDVEDAGEGLASLLMSDVRGAVNVASGEGLAIADIARMLGRLAGRPDLIQVGALADRAGEPPYIVADIKRLRDEVGFRPSLCLEDSLKSALEYWARRVKERNVEA